MIPNPADEAPAQVRGTMGGPSSPGAPCRSELRPTDAELRPTALRTIPLSSIVEKEGFNPREDYGHEDGTLAELVASIRESGVLLPPLVRSEGDGFVLIAGHRRVRAARVAGLTEITCIVRTDHPDPQNDLVLALVENLHRNNLSAIEKARGFARLKEMGLADREIARRLGCSQSIVSQSLALLALPTPTQKALEEKKLSTTVAYQLANGLKRGLSATKTSALTREAIKDNLTSYEVRERVNQAKGIGTTEVVPPVRPAGTGALRTMPTSITVTIDAALKPDVDWAIRCYGSVGGALTVLRRMTEKNSVPDLLEDSLTGTWRDPMLLVRNAQARRWSEILIGLNPGTGGMVALEKGPLQKAFVLVATILASGRVHIPMTANGRTRTLAEQIKDAVEGPRRAGLA